MRKTHDLIAILVASSFALAPSFANTGQLKPVLKAIDPSQAQVDPATQPPTGQPPTGQPPPGTGAITGAPIQPNYHYQPYQPSTEIPTYPPGASLPKGSYPPALAAAAPYPPGTKAPPASSIAPASGPPPGLPPHAVPPYGQPPAGAGAFSQPPNSYTPPNAIPPYGQSPPASGGWGAGSGGGYPPPGPQTSNDEQRVARMEQIAFGSPYPEHEVEDRVEHLEREVFSKAFTEESLQSRINRLEGKMGGGSAFSHTSPPAVSLPPRQSYPPAPTYPPRNNPPAYTAPPQQTYQPPQQTFPPVGNPPPQNFSPVPPQTFPPVGNLPPQTFPPVSGFPGQGFTPAGGPQPGFTPLPTYPVTKQPEAPAPTKSTKPAKVAPPKKGKVAALPPQNSTVKPSAPPFGGNAMTPPVMPGQPTDSSVEPIMGSLDPANLSANERTNIYDIVRGIPLDAKVGDYFGQIQRFSGACARWTHFPVRYHVPQNTPGNWSAAINSAINKWGQFVPTTVVATTEPADIEIAWINHLPPRQLGITNLEIFNGQMRVTVYLLRPTYYPKDVPEKTLSMVAQHEIGHSLGLFGHSFQSGDMMQAYDTGSGVKAHGNSISARDINTIRKVYEAPSLPSGFQSSQPISWSLTHGQTAKQRSRDTRVRGDR